MGTPSLNGYVIARPHGRPPLIYGPLSRIDRAGSCVAGGIFLPAGSVVDWYDTAERARHALTVARVYAHPGARRVSALERAAQLMEQAIEKARKHRDAVIEEALKAGA